MKLLMFVFSILLFVSQASPVMAEKTYDFYPVADASVSKSGTSDNLLNIAYLPNLNLAYVKFDLTKLAGKQMESMSLKMKVNSFTNGMPLVFYVPNNNWSEKNINFDNKPVAGSQVGSLLNAAPNKWAKGKLASAMQGHLGEVVTFNIRTYSSGLISLFARESGDKPTLTVTTK